MRCTLISDKLFEDILKDNANFLERCRTADGLFNLTPKSNSSAYATCFGVFLQHALKPGDTNGIDVGNVSRQVITELKDRFQRLDQDALAFDKPFVQLFSFVLSADYLIDLRAKDELVALAIATIPLDMAGYLFKINAHEGRPQSGNLAMCIAAICFFAWQNTGKDIYRSQLEDWFNFHLQHINKVGFWGKRAARHLAFQNGFHQYEIFEAFGISIPNNAFAVRLVNSLGDSNGFFAPYPGGGGCYDYDAASVLSRCTDDQQRLVRKNLLRLANSIIATKAQDGGFSETKMIRPLTPSLIATWALHCLDHRPLVFFERVRYMLALIRPKNDQINNHWSEASRDWSDSNLWDTWFRLLTLFKVQLFCDATLDHKKRFIGYPGIGVYGKVADISFSRVL